MWAFTAAWICILVQRASYYAWHLVRARLATYDDDWLGNDVDDDDYDDESNNEFQYFLSQKVSLLRGNDQVVGLVLFSSGSNSIVSP